MIKVYCIKDEKGVIGDYNNLRNLKNRFIYKDSFYYVDLEDWEISYLSHIRVYLEPKIDYIYLIAKFPRKSLISIDEYREQRINKILEG